MSNIKCLFFNPTTQVKRYFRRYEEGSCPGKYGYHNAHKFRDEIEVPVSSDGMEDHPDMLNDLPESKFKKFFPFKCDYCEFLFTAQGSFQFRTERQYRNEETGQSVSLHELPVGGMYFAPWYDDWVKPQLEHVLIVRTPGGLWTVDSQSRNCTMKEDVGQKDHHCWIIEGTLPNISVTKNGRSCQAGGGSIQCGNYHGFLRNGYLEEC